MGIKASANRYLVALESTNPPSLDSWALSRGAPNVWHAPQAIPSLGDMEGIWSTLGKGAKLAARGASLAVPRLPGLSRGGHKHRRRKQLGPRTQPYIPSGPRTQPYVKSLSDGMGDGMGGAIDDLVNSATSVVGAANAKAEKLQNALYLIIGLSGVAAFTGLLSAVRRA